jgi:hypothetical protein
MATTRLPTRRLPLAGFLTPQLLLVVAGVVVAGAILVGGQPARLLNGVGGALWVAAAVWMVASLRGERRWLPILAAALAAAAVMALIVRPGTYLEALVGFLVAGGAVALIARPLGVHWALLAPALYFPLHIAVAVVRVVASGGARSVRTDPPPTEAFVPLAMIAAAALGGAVVSRLFAPPAAPTRR